MLRLKNTITPLTAFYVILITVLSLVKFSQTPPSLDIDNFDKVVHFCFYFGLNILLLTLCYVKFATTTISRRVLITLLAIAYSAFIEVVQHFTGRESSIYDIAANSTGAIVGLLLFQQKFVAKIISLLS